MVLRGSMSTQLSAPMEPLHSDSDLSIECKLQGNCRMKNKNLPEDMIKRPLDEVKARELLDVVRDRLATRAGYAKLAGLSFFFSFYFITLLMQIKVEESFAVESRCENF